MIEVMKKTPRSWPQVLGDQAAAFVVAVKDIRGQAVRNIVREVRAYSPELLTYFCGRVCHACQSLEQINEAIGVLAMLMAEIRDGVAPVADSPKQARLEAIRANLAKRKAHMGSWFDSSECTEQASLDLDWLLTNFELTERKGSVRTQATEFPDWPEKLPVIEGYHDSCWHNDSCPSMESNDLKDTLRLWFEHPDATKRESGIQFRYSITRGDEVLINTNDFQVLIRNAEYYLAFFKWVETGKDTASIGHDESVRDEALQGVPGRVYNGYWIGKLDNGHWWTQIGSNEPSSLVLRDIEAKLYQYVERQQ